MGLRRLPQGELAVDADAQGALLHRGEDLARAPEQLLARLRVMGEARPREEVPLGGEPRGVEGADGAAGLAEEGEVTAHGQRLQAAVERRLAHAVVDDAGALAARLPLDLLVE